MPGGAPYASLVAYANHPDGSPILLVSRLAVHTQNLLADPRVSLLLHEGGDGDPLQRARIMIAATAHPATDQEGALVGRRYLAAHPRAELFVDFPDFLFVRLRIMAIHLVAGFGRIADVEPADVLVDVSDASELLAAEESAVAHMNDDQAEAVSLYATKLLGAANREWRCTGIDPEGLDLRADETLLRLDFPQRVTTPAALRQALVSLAAAARCEADSSP